MMSCLKTKKVKGLLYPYFLILAILTFTLSCEKPEDIGSNIVTLPGDNPDIRIVDTLSVNSFSERVDSVSSGQADFNTIGYSYDDVFGTTSAELVTQVRLEENSITFGDNPTCDSIVLSFEYSGIYGDETDYTFEVYLIDNELSGDSNYYSNDKVNTSGNALCIQNVNININDSVIVDGKKSVPQLRLKLDKSFGELILSKSGEIELQDNANFLSFIKGFKIIAKQNGINGGFVYLDLISEFSKMTLYYKNNEGAFSQNFIINENCASFCVFNHNGYQDASFELKAQIIDGEIELGNEKLFVQPLGGVRANFSVPFISNLQKDNPIAIQKAELIVSVDENIDTNKYPLPARINLFGVNSEGNYFLLKDFLEGTSHFGGVYNQDSNAYIFNITRSLQSLLLYPDEEFTFAVTSIGENYMANRVVLSSNKVGVRPIRIKVYFTEAKL